jgi:hypothetical protein
MFQRTNARLLTEHDLPNPNPKASPYKNMAVLTWLDDDGTITTTYGCRRTYAQFTQKQALFHYVGRVINGKTGKHSKRTKKQFNALESIQREIDGLKAEVEAWKKRARKAERDLDKFRALLKG